MSSAKNISRARRGPLTQVYHHPDEYDLEHLVIKKT
jgi:hypothetical protein